MTGIALKTEIEIFENANNLLILCPNLLHLLTGMLMKSMLYLLYMYKWDQKV
jgi:hypothetical protein